MASGLAATLYMPDGAKLDERFPALLEYLPYRQDDSTAAGDYSRHAYFARRGYVGARVDIRGFGNSEGTPPNREYSEQEQLDGIEVIDWLAHQPWSNGNVGMFGISWGGFNSIQMAMRQPPGLKAIIAIAATDELFHDDVHYMDGLMHIDEFELNMDMAPGMTGAPDYTLDEKVLGPRFDTPPWSLTYIKHQRDGVFWRSPVRPIEQIKIPCFLIGGMLDGYRDSIPKMLERVKAPVRALIGPWNHSFPNDADFGPQVEWREDAVRWWDYWLKGRDTGVMKDPKLTVFMRHYHPPNPKLETVPGEWRAEEGWPPKDVRSMKLFLRANHALADSPSDPAMHALKYVPSVGVEAGFWWGELLSDQRPVDAFSLVYDTVPLEEDVAILGHAHALLQVSADAPLADWFVRLSDVAPDQSSTLVAGAGISGAQRTSMSDPEPLEPGTIYPLDIQLHLASWVFPKGHRIRLAVSNALWPMIWPTPYAMTTRLKLGTEDGSSLLLPRVPLHGAFGKLPEAARTFRTTWGHQVDGLSLAGGMETAARRGQWQATVTWRGRSETDFPWGQANGSGRAEL